MTQVHLFAGLALALSAPSQAAAEAQTAGAAAAAFWVAADPAAQTSAATPA